MVVRGRCVEEYAGKIHPNGRQGEGRAGRAPAVVDEIGSWRVLQCYQTGSEAILLEAATGEKSYCT